MKLSDYFASVVRTVVPILVGAVISFLVRNGIDVSWLNEGEVSAWLTPVAIATYYGIVRAAEKKYPLAGWFLGLAKQPGYSDAPPPAPAPTDDPAYPSGPVFVNDHLEEGVEREITDGDDHHVPGDLLRLHEELEEMGLTPAAFAALFPEEKK